MVLIPAVSVLQVHASYNDSAERLPECLLVYRRRSLKSPHYHRRRELPGHVVGRYAAATQRG